MDLNALIEKQRASLETPVTDAVDVILGGELVTVEVTKLRPELWDDLVSLHPPRRGSTDDGVGYNQKTLPAHYPADRLSVGGEPVTGEQWTAIFASIDPAHRNSVGTVIWGINIYQSVTKLQALGKARAGVLPASPATSGSRRGGSKGGSRQK